MFHGNIFIRYNYQGVNTKGKRSDNLTDRADVPNWLMMMASAKIKKRGLLVFSAMFSADVPIMTGNGYPLLFQTGETFKGKPLVERQHPHDLFTGLSAGYTQQFSVNSDLTLYIGYPGEPALGPPAFMHRISSANNPDAPLGHHWQDATHISFGVVTIGYRYKIVKFEASAFTGREPDENRYDFDKPRFGSYSGRISVNPNENFSVQTSIGFLKSPEPLEPNEDVIRSTASLMHSAILDEKKYITTTLVWGMNSNPKGKSLQSFLLESNFQIKKFAFYGRAELIQKTATELRIPRFVPEQEFLIGMLTLGSNFNLLSDINTNLKIGFQASGYFADKALEPEYGKVPVAIEAYLRFSPFNTNAVKMKHKKKQN